MPGHLTKSGRLASVIIFGLIVVSAHSPARAVGSASCTLSTTSLDFGKYVPSRDVPTEFTATVYLACSVSGPTTASVEGTIGLIGPSGPAGRQLTGGGQRLRYQLFADPGRTILWGDGNGDTHTKAISGRVGPTTPMRKAFTIYGRLLARQSNAAVGEYSDQITAVLDY